MTPIRIILYSLLAVWLVLVLALLVPESSNARGVPHCEHPAMMKGEDALARHGSLWWHGLAFASLQLAIIVGLLGLGLPRRARDRSVIPIVTGFILLLMVFITIFVSYRTFMSDTRIALLGSFPAPTTFMIFGIWGASFFFVFFYVMNYDRMIFTADDAEEFQRLLHARREKGEDAE